MKQEVVWKATSDLKLEEEAQKVLWGMEQLEQMAKIVKIAKKGNCTHYLSTRNHYHDDTLLQLNFEMLLEQWL